MSKKLFSNGLSRRNFLKMGGASAAALTLGSQFGALARPIRAQDTSVTGTLTFWGHANHPLDNVREAFLQMYPNVVLDYTYSDDYTDKFQTAMAAGTGAPDLFWSEAWMVQLYGSQGALLETTDIIERNIDNLIPAKAAEAYVPQMEGYFGMPGDLSPSGIYYRGDILDELGIEIPTDMMYIPDFINILTEIAAAGKNAVLYPSGGTFVATAYWSWFDAQYGGSGPASCDNQEITLNDEAGVHAVELIKAMYDTGATLATDFWSPEYWNALNTDQLVLDLAPAWARGFWEANLLPEKQGMWRLAPLPRAVEGGPRTGIWGGATLISPASTENPDLVKLFMEFAFASMEGATAAGNWGIIPPYLPYLETTFQEEPTALFGDQNIGAIWLELAQEISPEFCRTAVYAAATDEFLTPAIDSMVTGGADIQATLDEVAEQVSEVLPDYQA
jgi:ABC-type glycerol-3-phosphate transport system substrate-binding protein